MRHGNLLTIEIVNFRWPHNDQDEEIAATQEGDKEDDSHCSFCLAEQFARDHGGGCVEFPDEEGDDEYTPNYERPQVMGTSPFVLSHISSIPDKTVCFFY